MKAESRSVFTIGHSTHSSEVFVEMLRDHIVSVLADVRSAPYSRFNPQFNKDLLAQYLTTQGMKYVFLGRELGARSEDPSCYENGQVQYARLARTELFERGIQRVIRGAQDHCIVLMCAEKEPLECHRTLLVARALARLGMDVQHIRADRSLESHEAAMERLLDVVGLPHSDMFRSRQDLIDEALMRQAERVAYVDEKLAADAVREKP